MHSFSKLSLLLSWLLLYAAPTFSSSTIAFEIVNTTTQNASDLHLEFTGTNGNLSVEVLLSNCTGTPIITISPNPNNNTSDIAVIDWGQLCVMVGDTIIIQATTTSPSISYQGGYWSNAPNQAAPGIGLGLIHKKITPFTTQWDWSMHDRTIEYEIDPILFTCITDTNPLRTLGDATLDAIDIWNGCAVGWTFVPALGPGAPELLITKDILGDLGPNPNYGEMDNPNGLAAPSVLAFFQRLTYDNMGELLTSKIVFNCHPSVKWGEIGADKFDPIIVALHELGHSMRLQHDEDVPAADPMGSIMRPQLAPGIHGLLPTIGDKCGAKRSAEVQIWPTPIFGIPTQVFLIGLLFIVGAWFLLNKRTKSYGTS